MKDAARPDPAAAAQRVKEGVRDLARGALYVAGDLAADVADGYRKSTRYFKLRAAVVASWALLSAITLWAACPSSGPTNALGAKFQLLLRSEPGVLMGTQVLVENESRSIWRDVVVTLDGEWRLERKTVRPQDRLVLSIEQFKKDGASAPADLAPREIRIHCSEGTVSAPLGTSR
jgi:hypothetical protein